MPQITPFLWFDDNAQEAMELYVSTFKNSRVISSTPFSVVFELNGQEFYGMNGGPDHPFSDAVSFFVDCEDQAEVDEYWEKLTANGGKESRCGWLEDKFGLSWQIVPKALSQALQGEDKEGAQRAMQAMLTMNKIDAAAITKAYEGK